MKKNLFSICVILLFSIAAFACESVSSYEALPAQAKEFLAEYFENTNVVYVEEDKNSLDVSLADGIEIEFKKNGKWEKVEGNYSSIPTSFIPHAVVNSIRTEYANASIIKIERNLGGFDVELDNRMELKIDNNGKIVRRKYDD